MATSHVFCDESHVEPHAYRVQGGIWVPATGMRAVREAFEALRAKHPKLREFKWSYVTGREPLAAYCDLMEMFFYSDVAPLISFRALVVRRTDDISQSTGKEGKDLGFFKTYFLLLRHRLKPGTDNHVVIDERSSPRDAAIEELARCLNLAGSHDAKPFRVLGCRMEESCNEDLLQLADVPCGALGWAYNGMNSTCGAKPVLHQQIVDAIGCTTLAGYETSRFEPKFNVWPFRPRKR